FISVAKYPEIDTSLIKTIDGRTLSTENAIKETFESSHGFSEAYNCDLMKKGSVERSHPPGVINYKAFDGGVACDYFVSEDIKYDQTYALHIKGENKAGRSLKIYLYDWETKRVRLEELLPSGNFDEYYVIYPRFTVDGSPFTESGYTLNIETRSFGRISSENIINTIEFIPISLTRLQGLTLQSDLEILSVKKFGTAIYKVETRGEGVLELGQGYEEGWISYPKLEHLKVNSWANGFKINSGGVYYIFFWPQFLEWGGFVVLIVTLISLTRLTKS
ncbi:MAG: hypothetical protein Q8Q30_00005, partial [Candidatus Woesebacteria bacterium]|nr:hypothetical protein [Candidatus Woesebacteria bacterium]